MRTLCSCHRSHLAATTAAFLAAAVLAGLGFVLGEAWITWGDFIVEPRPLVGGDMGNERSEELEDGDLENIKTTLPL